MRKKFGMAIVAALLAVPVVAHAQGIFGGMERGAAEGSAAGPVGGIVVGAGGGREWGARHQPRATLPSPLGV